MLHALGGIRIDRLAAVHEKIGVAVKAGIAGVHGQDAHGSAWHGAAGFVVSTLGHLGIGRTVLHNGQMSQHAADEQRDRQQNDEHPLDDLQHAPKLTQIAFGLFLPLWPLRLLLRLRLLHGHGRIDAGRRIVRCGFPRFRLKLLQVLFVHGPASFWHIISCFCTLRKHKHIF